MVLFKRRRGKRFRRRVRKREKLATQKYVKKALHTLVETKYFDTTSTGTSIDYSGTLVNLTLIPQGSTDVTRVADKATLRAVRLNFAFGVGDAFNEFRIIIFQWYPNTTLLSPIVADILAYTGSNLACQSPYVHDYQNQHAVLLDRRFQLVNGTEAAVMVRKYKLPMKYCRKTINFTAGTTGGSNHLYALFISDSAAATHPNVQYITRVYFDDS